MAQRKEDIGAVAVRPIERNLSEQEKEAIWERFWRAVDEIRALNADKDPDEVLREVTEIVEEVRQERYERTRRTQGGC